MLSETIAEARRQVEICNACRYCEGYCAVFPAMMRERSFTDGDITQLANLCHNCRGCYYACQYVPPHEFDLNLPAALAEVRRETWEQFVPFAAVSRLFQRRGNAIVAAIVLGVAAMILAIGALPGGGAGFYAYLSHVAMVAIFLPAFVLPLVFLAIGVLRYWRATGGGVPRLTAMNKALSDAARMRNLDGGQGQGCNFEEGDRFSNARRHAHHAVMYGFFLCFAATCSATVLHYGFGLEAPYRFLSLPKLLGVSGGVLMVVGTLHLSYLAAKSDPGLADRAAASGAAWFRWLLFTIAISGLALYAATGTGAVKILLAFHLGSVLVFFLLIPFTKMAHAPFRLAALLRDASAR